MKRLHQLLLALALVAFSQLALAGGGGGKSAPKTPPPPPPPEMPAQTKAPEADTFRRKNQRAGAMGQGGTLITDTDATVGEAGVNLGGNTLLGS